jgi:hypothetical protein
LGPQCCSFSGNTAYIVANNTTTAYNQGVGEAAAVASQLYNWGITDLSFPLVYDFEAYASTCPNLSACDAAVNAFLSGWVNQLHNGNFYQWAGGYGSTGGSRVSNWANAQYVPDFVWPADYYGSQCNQTQTASCRNTAWGLDFLPDSLWAYDQRHSQYRGTHAATYNGVTLNVDSGCGNGKVLTAPTFAGNPGYYGDPDSSGEIAGASEDDSYWCAGGIT